MCLFHGDRSVASNTGCISFVVSQVKKPAVKKPHSSVKQHLDVASYYFGQSIRLLWQVAKDKQHTAVWLICSTNYEQKINKQNQKTHSPHAKEEKSKVKLFFSHRGTKKKINLSHRNVITFSQPLSFIKPQLRLPGSCCTQLKLYTDREIVKTQKLKPYIKNFL